MPEWFDELVTGEAVYLVIGALLAGIVGYAVDTLRARRETKALRAQLFPMLAQEIAIISSRMPPTDIGSYVYGNPIRLSVLYAVLGRHDLFHASDQALTYALLQLHTAIAKHNDRVTILNDAANMLGPMLWPKHQLMLGDLASIQHLIIERRDDALKALEPSLSSANKVDLARFIKIRRILDGELPES